MLDVEVVGIVENSDGMAAVGASAVVILGVAVEAVGGGDGNGIERDW